MNVLENFQGRYFASGKFIQFNWDPKSVGTDSFVVIAGVAGSDNALKVICQKTNKIQNLPGQGDSFKLDNLNGVFGNSGVQKIVFCGFSVSSLAEVTDEAIFEIYRTHTDKLAQVMIGEAKIVWKAKTKVQDNVKIVEIELNSTSKVSQGVIGYQYSYGSSLQVKMPFPGDVPPGKQNYPAILIPKECEIAVVPYDSQFSGNLSIERKKGLFS